MDLEIRICEFTNQLKFLLYIKPTNTFQYLHIESNHPKSIFDNIPKSIFYRVRRNNSSLVDYYYHGSVIVSQLVKRGFNFYDVKKVMNMIGTLNRSSLLEYKSKVDSEMSNNIIFKTTFDFNLPNLNSIIYKCFDGIKMKFDYLKEKKILSVNCIQPNLSSLILHCIKYDFNKLRICKTTNCNVQNCKICPFIIDNPYLDIKGFKLPLFSDGNCLTSNLIYIIQCKRCGFIYVGETGTSAKVRISKHLSTIKLFNLLKYNPPVARHFNVICHKKYFSFCIFLNFDENKDYWHRRNIEKNLILLFLKLEFDLMNDKIDNINQNEKFTRLFFS